MSDGMFSLWDWKGVLGIYVCTVCLLFRSLSFCLAALVGLMMKRNDALDAQTTDWQNCNLYSTVIGMGGDGLWWNSPVSGQWFSNRAFGTATACYQPGDTVGNVTDM